MEIAIAKETKTLEKEFNSNVKIRLNAKSKNYQPVKIPFLWKALFVITLINKKEICRKIRLIRFWKVSIKPSLV